MALDTPRPKNAPPKAWRCDPWASIPPGKRFGMRLTVEAVPHLREGTLLRYHSDDPWFEPGEHSPRLGEIVRFTGRVDLTFPKIGPHLEVARLSGHTYPGGGWVFHTFQFVGEGT